MILRVIVNFGIGIYTAAMAPLPLPRFRALLLALPLSLLPGCPPPAPSPGKGTKEQLATRAELLEASGQCALSSARAFGVTLETLAQAIAAWEAQPDATTRAAAQEVFGAAMLEWEHDEVMQFGPAARRSAPGGRDLRDQLYSWPLVSRCAVEEQLVSQGYAAADFGTTLITRRGLDALEYLLFYEGEDTVCTSSTHRAAWDALSSAEKGARKLAYARVLVTDLQTRADELVQAWDPAAGNFLATLTGAAEGNEVYGSTQAALNAVSDALFYVELELKDMKLAKPLGLRECETGTCPELLEFRFAPLSKAAVRANLLGYRRLTEGCAADYTGLGFDDLLEAHGASELSTRMKERMTAALAAIDAIEEEDLADALASDLPSVRAMYDAVKGVTDILKIELVTVLDLELPQTVEGDND